MDRTLPRPLVAGPIGARAVHLSPELAGYHEMRAPLSLISTLARSADAAHDPELVNRYVSSIVRVADRTLRVISQMFDLRTSVEPGATTGLRHLAATIVEDHRIAGRELGFAYVGSEFTVMPAARPLLEAVLQTLLANAFEHGDPSEPVRLSLTADADAVQIQVRNRIAEERRAGSGFGTSIAESLVARFGGSVARSERGDEFKATVSLPAADGVLRPSRAVDEDASREQTSRQHEDDQHDHNDGASGAPSEGEA